MDIYEKNIAHRMGNAFNNATKSDFYSSDGKTRDENASTIYFVETSNAYKNMLLREGINKESSANSLDDLSPELAGFVRRVEQRLADLANSPVARNYKTIIRYSYENPNGGARKTGTIDLTALSEYELESMVNQVPEAQKELLYRAAVEKK